MKPDDLDLLVGRMFVFGLQGYRVTAEFANWYRRHPAGGIVLFRRNIHDAKQVAALTRDLHELGEEVRPGLRILVAVDQEGGSLSPLRGIVSSLPGNMGLAATGDPSASHSAGYMTGRELAGLGIDLNFAPVLDLASQVNPVVGTRAFSDDPAVAAEFGSALARGLHDAGVLFAAKHFPGHGSCREDSHLELPICAESLETLWSKDLLPFRAVAGIEGAALMFSHVRYDSIDPERPASLSPAVHDFARHELGFEGVMITDCLEMGAVQRFAPYPDDAVRAVEAGNDLILISHTPGHQEAAFRAVKEAFSSGNIPLSHVEESAARIARWKESAGGGLPPMAGELPSGEALAARVVTLRDGRHSWPLDRSAMALITPEIGPLTPAEDSEDIGGLVTGLAACGVNCSRIRIAANPGEGEILAALAEVRDRRVAFVLSNTARCPGQVELIRRLAPGHRVLLVSTRDPREARAVGLDLPAAFTYSTEAAVLRALARVLSGAAPPVGRLPVTDPFGEPDMKEPAAH